MDQELALEIMASGRSVLLTGPPGAGKTYILNQFIKHARATGKHVAVTATTGLAATHLNGTTIHSWSGIGVHQKLPDGFLKNMYKGRREIIGKADILIIDEVSMLHDFQLDMVDKVLRGTLGKDEPFGGIQIILCGDFFQLPPISRQEDRPAAFVLHSNVWEELDPTVCYLAEQHRHDDTAYLEILNAIRSSDIRRRHFDSLMSRRQTPSAADSIAELHTTRADVENINVMHLNNLGGESRQYQAITTGSSNYVESLKRSCLAADILTLKKGALVMCIRNDSKRAYVNGSMGTVIGFDKDTDYPLIRLNNDHEVVVSPVSWELMDGEKKRASLTQIPLQLAWAVTIHKSQGMTLDAARIDLRRAFVEGMGYVALSRLRNLESLYLTGINQMALRVSEEALAIDSQLRARSAADSRRFESLRGQMKTHQKKSNATGWADKLAKMRLSYPNAYKPWSKTDDVRLAALYTDSGTVSVAQISDKLGRHPGSIRARIKKNFGDEL